ncbi:hypothetical protein ACFE04_022704 [Oxalis oulophora]
MLCIMISLFFLINSNLISASDEDLFNSGIYHQLHLPGGLGPESIAFDCKGNGPYVGVSDGRILKWKGSGWSEFAIPSPNRNRALCDGTTNPNLEPTCGRPLGVKFNAATCDLYIADAYFGLLTVGPNGGVAKHLVNSAEGVPFRLTNALDIDQETGIVYFTDSSAIYQRKEYILSFNRGERTGRVLKYDPSTNQVSVLHRGLAFPNGIALNKNNSFLLVAEGGTRRILKFQLNQTKYQSTPQLFIQLIRSPDNIKRNKDGDFWIALNSGRAPFRMLLSANRIQDPIGIKLDEEGNILKYLNGYESNELSSVSEVEEHDGSFYLGSAVKPYVGVLQNLTPSTSKASPPSPSTSKASLPLVSKASSILNLSFQGGIWSSTLFLGSLVALLLASS